ncbi:MAG: hypothetical protein JRC92_10240 [Deltaproteobacteria bacterium]|nr:hypothetical protein [Deltaproteobacteria bacterium]
MSEQRPEAHYAPVFIMGRMRFVWFSQKMVAPTAEQAKRIGLSLEAGFKKSGLPIKAAHTVARFTSQGQYAMATLGPPEDEQPIIVLNPHESPAHDFEGGEAQQAATQASIEPVEEISYQKIGPSEFVRSVEW